MVRVGENMCSEGFVAGVLCFVLLVVRHSANLIELLYSLMACVGPRACRVRRLTLMNE
jgi:hypothetical protein